MRNFFVVYETQEINEVSTYSVNASIVGTPSPIRGPLTFTLGMDMGVTPESGKAGSTFTFKSIYRGSEAPKETKLLIDLDRDGRFAMIQPAIFGAKFSRHSVKGQSVPNSFMSGFTIKRLLTSQTSASWKTRSQFAMAPFKAKNTQIPVAFILIITLLFINTGFLLLMRRRIKTKAFLLPLAGLLIILFIGIILGCGGKGNGEKESYTMTEVDPSDTNFLDGKLYQFDVQIPDSGSYIYRFSFTDWTGEEAYGTATLTRTLIVN